MSSRYAPHLTTISESSLIGLRRYGGVSSSQSPSRPIRRVIDTADIDVSSPRTQPRNDPSQTQQQRLRRDRPTVKIRSQALKDNPALREYNERHEKSVGELLVEKFLIKDKKNNNYRDLSGNHGNSNGSYYHQPERRSSYVPAPEISEEDEDEEAALLAMTHKITRRMTRRRSSADVQVMDPERLQREAAYAQVQAEVLDSLVAAEQAEIEVETRAGTFVKRPAMRLTPELPNIADSESDTVEDEDTEKENDIINVERAPPKRKKRRRIASSKPSPSSEGSESDDEDDEEDTENQDLPRSTIIKSTSFKVEATNSVGDLTTLFLKEDPPIVEQLRESVKLPYPSFDDVTTEIVLKCKDTPLKKADFTKEEVVPQKDEPLKMDLLSELIDPALEAPPKKIELRKVEIFPKKAILSKVEVPKKFELNRVEVVSKKVDLGKVEIVPKNADLSKVVIPPKKTEPVKVETTFKKVESLKGETPFNKLESVKVEAPLRKVEPPKVETPPKKVELVKPETPTKRVEPVKLEAYSKKIDEIKLEISSKKIEVPPQKIEPDKLEAFKKVTDSGEHTDSSVDDIWVGRNEDDYFENKRLRSSFERSTTTEESFDVEEAVLPISGVEHEVKDVEDINLKNKKTALKSLKNTVSSNEDNKSPINQTSKIPLRKKAPEKRIVDSEAIIKMEKKILAEADSGRKYVEPMQQSDTNKGELICDKPKLEKAATKAVVPISDNKSSLPVKKITPVVSKPQSIDDSDFSPLEVSSVVSEPSTPSLKSESSVITPPMIRESKIPVSISIQKPTVTEEDSTTQTESGGSNTIKKKPVPLGKKWSKKENLASQQPEATTNDSTVVKKKKIVKKKTGTTKTTKKKKSEKKEGGTGATTQAKKKASAATATSEQLSKSPLASKGSNRNAPKQRPADLMKMFYTTPSQLLTATPRDLRKVRRAKVKQRRKPQPSGNNSSSFNSDSTIDTETTSTESNCEEDVEHKRLASTRSNDSGFDGSPRISSTIRK